MTTDHQQQTEETAAAPSGLNTGLEEQEWDLEKTIVRPLRVKAAAPQPEPRSESRLELSETGRIPLKRVIFVLAAAAILCLLGLAFFRLGSRPPAVESEPAAVLGRLGQGFAWPG